jgi:hypothetical protein
MRKISLLLFFFLSSFISYEQTEIQCISIKGDPVTGLFKQLLLDTKHDYESDTTQTEIVSAAWTCNAVGFPTCNFRGLFRYDVSAVPSNSIITSAKLYLYAKKDNINGNPGNPTYGTQNTSLLQKVTQTWQVGGTGWLNQPSATTANQKSLPQSTNTAENYVVDVTDFVQDWVSHPETNYGMLLRLQTEAYYNSMVFNSGQANDSLKPRLEICYRQSDACVSITGDRTSGLFKQLLLDTKYNYESDTTQTEIVSAAWTCNALGFPTCNFRGLFRYDVSAVPSNSVITSARLYLYAKKNNINGNLGNPTYGTHNVSLLQKVTQAWQVSGTGWLNQPAITTANQKSIPQSISSAENYVVEVTDFVQDWVNHPETNYGMLLRLETEDYYNSMVFNSGQAPDSLRPKLEICYNNETLPLTLKNFQASLLNNRVNLSWIILDGTSLSSIIVEKSFDGTSFKSTATIVAKNISAETRYYSNENLSGKGVKVYYRLKLVDKAGKYQYSNILVLSLTEGDEAGIQILPNPVRNNMVLNFYSQKNGNVNISILNSYGQTVRNYNYLAEKGYNSIVLNSLQSLSSNLYIVRLNRPGKSLTKKFIKE